MFHKCAKKLIWSIIHDHFYPVNLWFMRLVDFLWTIFLESYSQKQKKLNMLRNTLDISLATLTLFSPAVHSH